MRTLNRQRQWQGHEHSSSKCTTVSSFLPKIPCGENSPTNSQRAFSRVGLAKGAIPLWTRSSGRVDLQGNHLQLCIQICIKYTHILPREAQRWKPGARESCQYSKRLISRVFIKVFSLEIALRIPVTSQCAHATEAQTAPQILCLSRFLTPCFSVYLGSYFWGGSILAFVS